MSELHHRGVELKIIPLLPVLGGDNADLHRGQAIETPGGEHDAGNDEFLGWIGWFVVRAKGAAETLEFDRILAGQQRSERQIAMTERVGADDGFAGFRFGPSAVEGVAAVGFDLTTIQHN